MEDVSALERLFVVYIIARSHRKFTALLYNNTVVHKKIQCLHDHATAFETVRGGEGTLHVTTGSEPVTRVGRETQLRSCVDEVDIINK
jgi:hypothetical protein